MNNPITKDRNDSSGLGSGMLAKPITEKADLAKLRALEGRLRVAAATEANDDYSKPLTPQRGRMVARFDAMVEAADAINELLAIAEAVEPLWARERLRNDIADDLKALREEVSPK